MYSSKKILKIGDNTGSAVQDYSMQSFPEQETDGSEPRPAMPARTTRTDHLRLEAERSLVQARQEAKSILATARAKATVIKDEARKQGLSEGRSTAEQQVRAEFADALQLVTSLPGAFRQLQQRFYDEHQDVLVELALLVARKVVHREIKAHDDVVLEIVRNAVQLAVIREKLQVRVNPEDLAVCRQHAAGILATVDGVSQMTFEPDDTVSRGGAVITYAYGEIDARIEQQLDAVARELQRPDSSSAATTGAA